MYKFEYFHLQFPTEHWQQIRWNSWLDCIVYNTSPTAISSGTWNTIRSFNATTHFYHTHCHVFNNYWRQYRISNVYHTKCKTVIPVLIVCLCMVTVTEVYPCFFLSCRANARVKPAKTGHSPHSSYFLCCSTYCLFCVVPCSVCVYVYCTNAAGWLPNCS